MITEFVRAIFVASLSLANELETSSSASLFVDWVQECNNRLLLMEFATLPEAMNFAIESYIKLKETKMDVDVGDEEEGDGWDDEDGGDGWD